MSIMVERGLKKSIKTLADTDFKFVDVTVDKFTKDLERLGITKIHIHWDGHDEPDAIVEYKAGKNGLTWEHHPAGADLVTINKLPVMLSIVGPGESKAYTRY